METAVTLAEGALAIGEVEKLLRCESAIQRNLTAFLEAGEALATIRDERLYRASHGTFEAYCVERWGMSKTHANRLIGASEIAGSLAPIGVIAPANEAQMRALSKAGEGERAEVWQEAVTRNGGEPAPARVVEQVIAERHADTEDERARALLSGHFKPAAIAPLVPPVVAEKAARDGDEWYTPAAIATMVRDVLGTIDLDPASCAAANETIQAACYYAQQDDGLALPRWYGRMFLNPPYSSAGDWIERLVSEVRGGHVDEAIALVNAKTETAWFGLLWAHATICFVSGRISFVPGDGGESQTGRSGSAVAYLGPNPERFREVFARVGVIARRWEA